MKKVNITAFYCLILTLAFLVSTGLSIWRVNTALDRIDYLEDELKEIKKEVVTNDYQSLIQLHYRNK